MATYREVGELVTSRLNAAADTLARRRKVAEIVFADLRRRGALREPAPVAELPPHPAVPPRGHWMQQVHRMRSLEIRKPTWHVYSGIAEPARGGTHLIAKCGQTLWLAEWSARDRYYVEHQPNEPGVPCLRCIQGERGGPPSTA